MPLRHMNTRCGPTPVSEAKAKLMFDSACHRLALHVGCGTTLRNLRYRLQTADDLPPQEYVEDAPVRFVPCLTGFGDQAHIAVAVTES